MRGKIDKIRPTKDPLTGIVKVQMPISGAVVSFKKLYGAVAWGDTTQKTPEFRNHAIIIGGEREESSIIHVFREATFPRLSEVARFMVNQKDANFVQTFFIPKEPKAYEDFLYDWDGLTRYQSLGLTRLGANKWRHKKEHWPEFRSRDHVAEIYHLDLSERDFDAASDLVDLLAETERVGQSRAHLPKLRAAKEDVRDLKSYPIVRAYIGLVSEIHGIQEGRTATNPTRPEKWPWDFLG